MFIDTAKPDPIEVKAIVVLGHYKLRLFFSDGHVGDVDVSDVGYRGNPFADLRDPASFAQVHVDHDLGTIVWPNGLDIALAPVSPGSAGLGRSPEPPG